METPFADRLREVMMTCFSQKKILYHYLSMAERNYREFLTGDTVNAKKYFYVLRPVLACRWVLNRHAPPPMKFQTLAEAELPSVLSNEVRRLLQLKTEAPERKEIPRVDTINDFLEQQLSAIKEAIPSLPEEKASSWAELNALFLSAIA